MNSIAIGFTVFALLLKTIVLISAFNNREKSALFFSLTLVFCVINLCSLIIVSSVADPAAIEWIFKPHYVAMFWATVLMVAYAAHAAQLKVTTNKVNVLLLALGIAFSALILGTNQVVDGVESIGYSTTAIKGDLFGVYMLLAACCFITTVTILVRGVYLSDSQLIRNRCSWTLLALLPVVLICSAVIVALMMGLNINGSGLVALGTSLFLIITLKSEAAHKLTDVRHYLPFSVERKTANEMLALASKFSLGEIDYREYRAETEKVVLEHAYAKTGTVTGAAKLMGMARSTVSNLISKHGIKES